MEWSQLTYLVHGRPASVGIEAGHTLHGASEQGAEEFVEMGQEEASEETLALDRNCCGAFQEHKTRENSLLLRCLVVGRHVLLERVGTAAIEEVDRFARRSASVGGLQSTSEVRSQVDRLAVDLTLGQDTGNLDAYIRLCIYTDYVSIQGSLFREYEHLN